MRAEHETKQGSFWVRDPVWHHRSLGHDAGPGSNCRHISNLTTHILENWIKVKVSCTVMSVSLWPHGLLPARLLCPWNFPGKNTGVGCHFFSRESSPPRDWTWVSCIAGRFFTNWVTRKSHKIEYNDTCKKKKKKNTLGQNEVYSRNPRLVQYLKVIQGTSLVVQWLRLCVLMQEAWVRPLVRELDQMCCNQFICHN